MGNKFILQWRIATPQEPLSPRGVTALSTMLIVGLGLLALAPVTDADSVSYHIGVALAVLNSGAFPVAPEWFQSRLAGSGEVLIALGLSIGAEQFGALLQFLGVVTIMGILRHAGTDRHRSDWAVLAFLSCPVLVAWTASPKPLLLPMAMTTLALYLASQHLGQPCSQSEKTRPVQAYILICLLVMVAATNKLNFFLSGGLVGLLSIALLWRRGLGGLAIGWGVVLFLIVLFPAVIWKHSSFGGALWEPLLNPFPGNWPGTDNFKAVLRAYRDTSVVFPLLLVIPDGLGTVTTILGVGVASLILVPRVLREPGPSRTVVILAIALALISSLVGQKASRFYVEPMIWLILALLLWAPAQRTNFPKGWAFLLRGQALMTLTIIVLGVATLSIGAVSNQMRHDVMSHRANGYQATYWLDQVAPPDARVISGIRSLGLLPRYPVSDDWRGYAAGEQESVVLYQSLVNDHAPDHMLLETAVGKSPRVPHYGFEIVAGPAEITMATRNPLNSGVKSWVWLLRLEQPKTSPMGTDTGSKGAEMGGQIR